MTTESRILELLKNDGLGVDYQMAGRAADAEIARLQAQVAELQKLSVRNIMLAIVPGDWSGQEIYAESVEDVVSALTTTDEKNETLQAQVDALAGALQAQDALSKKGLLQAEAGEMERVAKLRKEALAAVGR